MYEKYGLEKLYYSHLDQRIKESLADQESALKDSRSEEFKKEVASGEVLGWFQQALHIALNEAF